MIKLALAIIGIIAVLSWFGWQVSVTRHQPEADASGLFQSVPDKAKRQLQEFRLTFPEQIGDLRFMATGGVTGSETYRLNAPIPIVATASGIDVVDPKTGAGIRWLADSPKVEPDAARVQDRAKVSHQSQGLIWVWTATGHGVKLTAKVDAPRGRQTYSFPFELVGDTGLELDAETGRMIGNGFQIQPVEIVDALNVRYSNIGYSTERKTLSFTWDDSVVPLANYPYVIDPTVSFGTQDTGDDAYSAKQSATAYPPLDGTNTFTDSGAAILVRKTTSGVPEWENYTGFIAWDTSSLPDDAIVTSASVTLYADAITSDTDRSLVIAWLDKEPPFSVADHVNDQETGDIAYTFPASAISPTANRTYPLDITNHTINSSGKTSLRLSVSGPAVPTGETNDYQFESFDDGVGNNPPTLSITYVDPVELTVPELEEVIAVQNSVETGDLLFLVHYDINTEDLATLPLTLASDAYVATISASTTVLQTRNPVATSENALRGYGHGLIAFYFTAAQVTDNGLTFGSPGVYTIELQAIDFPTVTTSTTSVDYLDRTELLPTLQALAQHYEATWGIDVLDGGERLTLPGQSYFESVDPFICDRESTFCQLSISALDTTKSTFGTTEQDRLDTLWDGIPTAINPKAQRDVLAGLIGLNGSDFMVALLMVATFVAMVILIPKGINGSWILAAGMISTVFAAGIGLVDMEVALILGLMGVIALVGTFIWRRASQ